MPKKFKHQDFSECPIFLGRNEKNQHLQLSQAEAKISKIAQKISKQLRKKMS
jgi:hypothetical protein